MRWLLSLPGITAGMAATTLPEDTTSWAATGFLTVHTVGGTPNGYYALRRPVLVVDTWAVSPGSDKAPWGLANNLAETVVAGPDARGARLTLPGSFPPATVLEAQVLTEPRRVYGDTGGLARYTLNVALTWAAS